MPITKKKRPNIERSERNAFLFCVVNACIVIVLAFFIMNGIIDSLTFLFFWIFMTLAMLIFLWFYDMKAALDVMELKR